jgi:hypothetical protein
VKYLYLFSLCLFLACQGIQAQNEKADCVKSLNKINDDIKKLNKNYEVKKDEMDKGYFCSECLRSRSEIQESGEDFMRHIERVHGKIVPATGAQKLEAYKQYQDRYNQLDQQYKDQKKNCDGITVSRNNNTPNTSVTQNTTVNKQQQQHRNVQVNSASVQNGEQSPTVPDNNVQQNADYSVQFSQSTQNLQSIQNANDQKITNIQNSNDGLEQKYGNTHFNAPASHDSSDQLLNQVTGGGDNGDDNAGFNSIGADNSSSSKPKVSSTPRTIFFYRCEVHLSNFTNKRMALMGSLDYDNFTMFSDIPCFPKNANGDDIPIDNCFSTSCRVWFNQVVTGDGWTWMDEFWSPVELENVTPQFGFKAEEYYDRDNLTIQGSDKGVNAHLQAGPDNSVKEPLKIGIHGVQPFPAVVYDNKKGFIVSFRITRLKVFQFFPEVH